MTNVHKWNVALFIGRFQPFHNGHLYSLKKCLEIAEAVKVVVAKSNVSGTKDDPWGYRVRKRMVKEVVDREGIVGVAMIRSCPDYPSDDKWLREIKRRVGPFEVVVSNNEWVLSIFKEAGYTTYKSGLHKREELEGVKIREMMRRGDMAWKKRVPKEVVGLVRRFDVFVSSIA